MATSEPRAGARSRAGAGHPPADGSPGRSPGREVVVVVGEDRPARTEALRRLLSEAENGGAATRLDDARRRHGGVWGPVAAWVCELVLEGGPELVRHQVELRTVLPERADAGAEAQAPLSLTESARGGKRVRMFPADRVLRTVHGVAELLGASMERRGGSWAVGWDGFESAGTLSRRTLLELLRRYRGRVELQIFVTASPATAAAIRAELEAQAGGSPRTVEVAAEAEAPRDGDPRAAGAEAQTLEETLTGRPRVDEPALFRLLDLWERSGDSKALARCTARTLICLNRLNYYEDALPLAHEVAARLSGLGRDDEGRRIQLLIALYGTFVATGNAGEALELLEAARRGGFARPDLEASCEYMLAMLHVRYLETKDLDRAERHLHRGLDLLASASLPRDEERFQTAFLRNGLALVVFRRGRSAEAIEICHRNLASVDQTFAPGEQLLFRSILRQNLAQVLVAEGRLEEAVVEISRAIEIDPEYPDHYNDRGALHLELGRPLDARGDFQRAIDLSPPYAEVWANLGQAERALERWGDAVKAYSRALELAPDLLLARIGRAQALRSLGDDQAAWTDYSEALALDPDQPLVRANRAAISYSAGRPAEAVKDLELALESAPDHPALRRNLALAREALAGG